MPSRRPIAVAHRRGRRPPFGDFLRGLGTAILRLTFPPRVDVPADVERLLAVVYPRLDLERLSFHEGMPHVLSLLPYHAITLPATFGVRHVRIYIRRRFWRLERVDGLGLLVHEAFHAQQIQDALGGRGLGLLRPFPVLYLACAAANGFLYHGHPLEDDAYELAGRRSSRFERALRARAVAGVVEEAAIAEAAAELARETSGLAFWRKAWASVPGLPVVGRALRALTRPLTGAAVVLMPLGWLLAVPLAAVGATLVGLWLALWTAATAILWGLEIAVVGLGGLLGGALAGLGALVSLGRRG